MNKLILTTAVLALTASMSLGETIRIATEGAYEPYNFINDDGELDGFEIVLGNIICERAELTCVWQTEKWEPMIPNLMSSNYDVIMAGMSVTAERDSKIDFTEQYTVPDPSAYVALSSDVNLSGAIIAAQVATIQASFVAEMPGVTLVEFATPEETISAVKNGEADAVLADLIYLKPIADADADLVLLEKQHFIGGGVAMGVRESDNDLRDKLSVAIRSVKADGTLNALIVEWGIGSTFP